ncbi:Transketolase [Anaerovibrio sp. JC8]|uniref:transketolase n=1 Tax=Anaerovibrio sp. JC8 TaxID=1240085 RepID=UPI000A0E18E3|nr:transketolase [Anaerovibrio sp. JC8]ORU00183.1 Transketolase [Anaerovibrio sp. JC8]
MNLEAKALDIRKDIVELIYSAGCGHIGGDLSVTDILVDLYYKQMNVDPDKMEDPNRDRFVLSKGHSVEALYCVLADRGFFDKKELFDTYSKYLSKFIGHPNNKINGVEMNTGSLGHGLSVAVGMAMAGKMDKRDYRVYAVMGDGEMAEGSNWEAVNAGAHYKLDNLTAFVDRNRLQISGTTEEVMNADDQEERWAAFGWNVISIPGNNMEAIDDAVEEAKKTKGKPTVIIANTTKGCGVSFIENKAAWHHKVPTEAEYKQALQELDERRAQL